MPTVPQLGECLISSLSQTPGASPVGERSHDAPIHPRALNGEVFNQQWLFTIKDSHM
jgi:hypothetical protein